jgi:hypothetical protein
LEAFIDIQEKKRDSRYRRISRRWTITIARTCTAGRTSWSENRKSSSIASAITDANGEIENIGIESDSLGCGFDSAH